MTKNGLSSDNCSITFWRSNTLKKITKINNPWKGTTRNLAPGYSDKHILREKWPTIITKEKRGHLRVLNDISRFTDFLFWLKLIHFLLNEQKKLLNMNLWIFLWILGKEWYNGAVANSVHFCLHHPINHTFNIVKQTRQLYYLQLVISPSVWKSHWTSSLRYEEISQDTHT